MARIFAAFGILERVLAGGMRIDRRDSLDRHGRVVMTPKDRAQPLPHRPPAHHRPPRRARARGRRGDRIQFAGRVSRSGRRGDARERRNAKGRPRRRRRRHQLRHPRSARPARPPHLRPRLRRAHQHSAAAAGDRRRRPRRHGDDRGLGRQAARALLPGDQDRVLRAAHLHGAGQGSRGLADRSRRLGALLPVHARSVRAHARRGRLAAIALGALPDHPAEALVGGTHRGAGRRRARHAALSRAGRGPRDDECARTGRSLARGRHYRGCARPHGSAASGR